MDEFNSYYSAIQNQIAQNNSWSAEQAKKQMEFQERMSNTAHQREIADLKAAGLNPVLSAKLGGASTPSGTMGQIDQSGTQAIVQLMTKVLDIQADNAKAQMYAAARNAAGSSGSASSIDPNYSSDITNLAQALGINTNTAKALGKLPDVADRALSKIGLSEDSTIRKYIRGEVSGIGALADSKLGEAIKTSLQDAKDFYNPNKQAATSTGQAIKNTVNKVAKGIKSVANDVKSFASWLVTGKKSNQNNNTGLKNGNKR